MGLFLVWCNRLICIVLSLCKHACKKACDVKQGIDPYPLLARSCDRWWPHFVTFTACKRSRFRLKRGKKAQCVSNRYKDLSKWGLGPPSAVDTSVARIKGTVAINQRSLKLNNYKVLKFSIMLTYYILPPGVDISGAEIKRRVVFNKKRLQKKNKIKCYNFKWC